MKKPKSKLKKSLSSNKLVIAFIILGAISCFIYLRLPKSTPININEITPSASGITLSLPSSVKSTIGAETSIDLTISSGSLAVTAAQVELSYDPSSISTPTLHQGDFLTEKLGNPKIQNGKINFVYTIPMQGAPKSGTGKLATLTFELLKDNASISFTENTMIAASGLTSNALGSATGTTITSSSSPTTFATPSPVISKPSETQLLPTRVFNETGNFDYSKSPQLDIDVENSPTPRLTGFAAFLAQLKTFFGGPSVKK